MENQYEHFKKMNAPFDATGLLLETERLILRPIEVGDLEALHTIRSTPEIAQFDGWDVSQSLEDTRKALVQAVESREELALVLKQTGKMIGTFALQARPWPLYPINADLQGREYGFDLNKDYWGRGLMPEAILAMNDYCFRELRFDFITCGYFSGNTKSARVIEKCGFDFLFEDSRTMPSGDQVQLRTYILYRPNR